MIRYSANWFLASVLSILLLAGCSSSKITASWVDPTYSRSQLRSVLVLGVSDDEVFRRSFEDTMGRQLGQYGLTAVPSYRSISGRELPDKQDMEQWVSGQKVDAVLVSRLVGMHQEAIVSPGYTRSFGPPTVAPYWGRRYHPAVDPYHGWYSYYAGSYDIIHYPPQVTYYQIYTVETTMYLVSSDQPIWSARSELSPKDDLSRLMEDFVSQLVKNMVDLGVL